MTIRPFTPKDTDAVMALWYDVTVHDQAFVPPAFWKAMRKVVATDYLPAARTWVAEDEGTVVGFISLIGDTIGGLFVARTHQSQGIGAALVAHVAQVQQPLYVEVYEKNTRARAFYRRCGFVEIARLTQAETGEVLIRKHLQSATR